MQDGPAISKGDSMSQEAWGSGGSRHDDNTSDRLYKPEDLAAFLDGAGADAWAGELADPALAVRIVEDQGEAVGFAKVGPVKLPVTPTGPAAELRQLYILQPWHGRAMPRPCQGFRM